MNVLQLVLFIIETALTVMKAKLSGAAVNVPEALVRIMRAGYQAYKQEAGQPLDVEKIKPFEPLS